MKKRLLSVTLATALSLTSFGVGAVSTVPALAQKDTNTQTTVTVKSTSVTPDKAIDIAVENAGLTRDKVTMVGTPSLDDDNKHYDIEFKYNGIEYDYEIAVSNGAILKVEKENEVKTQNTQKAQSGYISVETAKQKALSNAGISSSSAKFTKAYLDSDDSVPHYEIKFEANGYEYEYEIKASNGVVLEKDVEKITVKTSTTTKKATTKTNSSSSSNSTYISKDKAKSIALSHAGVSSANAKFVKVEFDKDDKVPNYEVEFVSGNYEYEYEINAKTGKVIEFDKELDD